MDSLGRVSVGILQDYESADIEPGWPRDAKMTDVCTALLYTCNLMEVSEIRTNMTGSEYDILSGLADKLDIPVRSIEVDRHDYNSTCCIKAQSDFVDNCDFAICRGNYVRGYAFDDDYNSDFPFAHSTTIIDTVERYVNDDKYDDNTCEKIVQSLGWPKEGMSDYSHGVCGGKHYTLDDLSPVEDVVNQVISDGLANERFYVNSVHVDSVSFDGLGNPKLNTVLMTKFGDLLDVSIDGYSYEGREFPFTRLSFSDGKVDLSALSEYVVSWEDDSYATNKMILYPNNLRRLSEDGYNERLERMVNEYSSRDISEIYLDESPGELYGSDVAHDIEPV